MQSIEDNNQAMNNLNDTPITNNNKIKLGLLLNLIKTDQFLMVPGTGLEPARPCGH